MAGANKRTTAILAAVAIIFIIVIIILCLVPDPCRRYDPRPECRAVKDPSTGGQQGTMKSTEVPESTSSPLAASTEMSSSSSASSSSSVGYDSSSTEMSSSSSASSSSSVSSTSSSTEMSSSSSVSSTSSSTEMFSSTMSSATLEEKMLSSTTITTTPSMVSSTSSDVTTADVSETISELTSTLRGDHSSTLGSTTDSTTMGITSTTIRATTTDLRETQTNATTPSMVSSTSSDVTTADVSETISELTSTLESDHSSTLGSTTDSTTMGITSTTIRATTTDLRETQTNATTPSMVSSTSSDVTTADVSETISELTSTLESVHSSTLGSTTDSTTMGITSTTIRATTTDLRETQTNATTPSMVSSTSTDATTVSETVTELSTTPEETTTSDATTTISTDWHSTTEEYVRSRKSHEEVCNTPICREVARRMLDIMDPNDVDPCEDFYQFSCGGILDDPFLKPESAQYFADSIIKSALANGDRSDKDLRELFIVYDSCLNVTRSHQHQDLTQAVKDVIESIGYTINPWGFPPAMKHFSNGSKDFDLTEALAGIMKLNLAPFFDILIDVSETNTDQFELKMVLPSFKSPFSEDRAQAVCYAEYKEKAEEAKRNGEVFDVDSNYEDYVNCSYTGKGLEARINSVRDTVEKLGILNFVENVTLREQIASSAIFELNNLLEKIASITPSPPEIRKALLNKNYERFTMEDIDDGKVFGDIPINFEKLLEGIMGEPINPAYLYVQVYFKEVFKQIFEILYDAYEGQEASMQNVMVLLWMERVYDDLVTPLGHSPGSSDYCFSAVTNLMDDYVSHLYLSEMNNTDYKNNLREMKQLIRLSNSVMEEQLNMSTLVARDEFFDKTRNMKGELAYKGDRTISKIDVSENDFVTNYENLQKNYRKRLYSLAASSPKSSEALWSVLQFPYRTSAVTSYGLNTFLVPHGSMAPPYFYRGVPHYLNYAGIGHMIAHELMHGFDSTGMEYNGERRQNMTSDSTLVSQSECLAEQLMGTYTLNSSTGLAAQFTLHNKLGLNELLADVAATRLAWDTYLFDLQNLETESEPRTAAPPILPISIPARRRRKRASKSQRSMALHGSNRAEPLPSMSYDDLGFIQDQRLIHFEDYTPLQLYFLKTAQNQCSATSEIDLIGVKENEHLPPQLRVKLTLGNSPLFRAAFKCGSNSTHHGRMIPVDGQCPFNPLGESYIFPLARGN